MTPRFARLAGRIVAGRIVASSVVASSVVASWGMASWGMAGGTTGAEARRVARRRARLSATSAPQGEERVGSRGKAIASSMPSSRAIHASVRSRPRPNPLCGALP